MRENSENIEQTTLFMLHNSKHWIADLNIASEFCAWVPGLQFLLWNRGAVNGSELQRGVNRGVCCKIGGDV